MIRLTREVRFSLPRDLSALRYPVSNSWAGWPTPNLNAPSVLFRATLAGEVDADTGYLFNIKLIDEAIRQQVIAKAIQGENQLVDDCEFLRLAWRKLQPCFAPPVQIEQLTLCPTPWLSWTISKESGSMILLTQQFEFSAAHRLHNPGWTDQQNRELFGKCNNPHGHGHNYLVDVTVGIDEGENGKSSYLLSDLEATVRKQVLDRVDHRNLNVEIAEFKSLNPTVENIAVVFWKWINDGPCPGTLRNVRVYETPKTWADFSGMRE